MNQRRKVRKKRISWKKDIENTKREKMEALENLRCITLENEHLKETERVLLNTFDMMKKYVDGKAANQEKDEVNHIDQLDSKCGLCDF